MSEATPIKTPCYIGEDDAMEQMTIMSAEGSLIAVVTHECVVPRKELEARAKLIVRAVNRDHLFDELVAACEHVVSCDDAGMFPHGGIFSCREVLARVNALKNIFGIIMKTTQSIADIVGPLTKDRLGEMLGTRFKHFNSRYGIQGLAAYEGSEIDFLAVAATRPRSGAMTRMLKALKTSADRITFIEVWNENFANFLVRQGFVKENGVSDEELVEQFTWRRHNPEPTSTGPQIVSTESSMTDPQSGHILD